MNDSSVKFGPGQPSRTSIVVAALRAFGAKEPDPSVRNPDGLAGKLITSEDLDLIAAHPISTAMRQEYAAGRRNREVAGMSNLILVRTRFIDDQLQKALESDVAQVVILGAGFDTMALRVEDASSKATVFEVDHPATQCVKREAFARIETPANVRFVAVDFERDDYVAKLVEEGFAAERRSLIVWLGVTCYLTAQAILRAMNQIARLRGTGTRLVFDYILADVIDGTSRNREALQKARRMARLGEPWLFGLAPEQVRDYLAPLSLHLLTDYGAEELRARYCPERPVPMDYVRIVVCERV